MAGPETVKDIKTYMNTIQKLANARNRLIFLHECKRKGLIPNFISNSFRNHHLPDTFSAINQRRIDDINHMAMKDFLNITINECNHNIIYLDKILTNINSLLTCKLPPCILNDFFHVQEMRYKFLFNKIKSKHLKKIIVFETPSVCKGASTWKVGARQGWVGSYPADKGPLQQGPTVPYRRSAECWLMCELSNFIQRWLLLWRLVCILFPNRKHSTW